MLSFSTAQKTAQRLLVGPQRHACLAGGTRSGKTFLIVQAIIQRAIEAPESAHALLRFHGNAAKASLALDTVPTVLRLCYPEEKVSLYRTDLTYNFENGSKLSIGGLDDDARVEKILGREFASVFLNEASQIPYESAMIAFTRLAQVRPELMQRAYVDLNPTNKLHWTHLLFAEKRDPVTRLPLAYPDDYALAYLNPRDNAANLSPAYIDNLERMPERLRRRFYEGIYVDAVDDALWTYDLIDGSRAEPAAIEPDDRKSVIVGVDPSGGDGPKKDETGIIVAALGDNDECYILADRSTSAGAKVWARTVVNAFHEFSADCVVAEVNYGGDMVVATIQAADSHVPIKKMTASRGKAVRAEPIALRYDQGQVHHVGRFPRLEEQLCAFSSAGYGGAGSPDRADAAIWALTALFERTPGGGIIEYYRDLDKAAGDQPSPACGTSCLDNVEADEGPGGGLIVPASDPG